MPLFILSPLGAVHLAAALLAMFAGGFVVLDRKGTRRHRQMGYVYAAAMLVVIGTALSIYRLFGTFGPFHGLALVATASLVAGMVPVMRRNRRPGWLQTHYDRMTWSVIGLYAAFWAETLVRFFPMKQFWPVVVGATVLTMAVGGYFTVRYRSRLLARFAEKPASLPNDTTIA